MTDRPDSDLTPSPVRRIVWSVLFVVLIAGTGAILWWAYQTKQKAILDDAGAAAPETAPAPPSPGQAATGSDGTEAAAEDDEFVARADTTVAFDPVPTESAAADGWLRTQLPKLNRNPRFLQWLQETPDLLRKGVLLVSEVAQGRVPRRAFAFWAPRAPFPVREVGDGQYVVDPAGYHRYDALAAAVEAFDMDLLWRLYRLARPLVERVYAEFAPPGARFETTLLEATERLLRTPQPRGEIRLVKPSVTYKYADPALEALSPAQKQLLRMGPVNATIIKHQLGLLRGLLLKAAD